MSSCPVVESFDSILMVSLLDSSVADYLLGIEEVEALTKVLSLI